MNMRARIKAGALHLGASASIAVTVAVTVFALWYPWPFRDISGGRELFLMIVAIDVIIGPLLTSLVFDTRKEVAALVRDVGVIVVLQLVALAYGAYTMALARPAVVALEGDRLRVVRAIDLSDVDLSRAPAGLRRLSWTGPIFVSTRSPTSQEKADTVLRALAGEDIGMRPEFWLPAEQAAAGMARAARPLSALVSRQPAHASVLMATAAAAGAAIDELGFLPIVARRTDWTAVLRLNDGHIVGYVPVDGF